MTLLEDKSENLTAQLLGLAPSSLHSWRVRRGLKSDRTQGKRAREEIVRRDYKRPDSPEASYWKGRAEALEIVVRLLLAPHPQIPTL